MMLTENYVDIYLNEHYTCDDVLVDIGGSIHYDWPKLVKMAIEKEELAAIVRVKRLS
jgi:hypothetical protein